MRRAPLSLARITAPATVGSLRASTPVNYLRLAATAGIFAHLGETVTVRVKVVWEESHDQTLIGILRAPHPAGEALVVKAPSPE